MSEDIDAAEYESNVLHTARMEALQRFPDGASTPQVLATLDILAADRHYRAAGFDRAVAEMRTAGYLSDLTDNPAE